MPDQQQTLSIPSLLLLAAFAAVTIRYFFFAKPSAASSPPANPRAANPADVEQITAMFPQIGRREIVWDLQRNGGSVNATTERILGRGSLDSPPPSFQPVLPAGVTPSTAHTIPGQMKSDHVDLITRYNLGSRLSSPPSTLSESRGPSGSPQTQSWSNNKNERQALLRRRREDMILGARRRLEERERERLQQDG